MTKREAPPILVQSIGGRLAPVSAMDAELLDALPRSVDLEVTIKHRKRSLPQQGLYWKMLSEVVKSTDKFPTPGHLHDEIKMALGYTEQRVTFDGLVYYRADSTAFDKMDAGQFKDYFDKAVALIADKLGVDPLAWLYDEVRAS